MSDQHKDTARTIEYSLLGLLNERPMHGYELFRRLRGNTGLGIVWRVKQSNLYGLLARLSAQGLVSIDRQDQPNRPAKKVFHLTESGRQAFLEWLGRPVQHGRSLRMDFIAKLYFAQKIDPGAAKQLVATQKSACTAWYDENQRSSTVREQDDFDRLVYEFRAGQLHSMIKWLDACKAFLSGKEENPTARP